jgi:hypothetical protein
LTNILGCATINTVKRTEHSARAQEKKIKKFKKPLDKSLKTCYNRIIKEMSKSSTERKR